MERNKWTRAWIAPLLLLSAGCGTPPEKQDSNPAKRARPEAALLAAPSDLNDQQPVPVESAPAPAPWSDGLASGKLDAAIWEPHSDGDFSERIADVLDTKKLPVPDWRLRLRAATMDTRDDTVKFFGLHTRQAFSLKNTRVRADIDWNDQANGCYMSAGVILSPESTTANPLTGNNWLKVEYIGVPPGLNARIEISIKANGRERALFNESWPEKNRAGRPIALQHLEIAAHDGMLKVSENEKVIYESNHPELPFETAHLYLQMSSHSNYPAREIYFSAIKISPEK